MPDQSTFLLDELSMLGRPDFHENTLPSFLPSFFSLLLSPAFFHCREAFPLTVSRFPVTIPQCKKKKKRDTNIPIHPARHPAPAPLRFARSQAPELLCSPSRQSEEFAHVLEEKKGDRSMMVSGL